MVDQAQAWVVTAVLAVVAAVALRAFFVEFSIKWPENYFGGSTGLDPVVSRSPLRYAAFRFSPVLAVLLVVGVVASRLDISRDAAVICSAGLHAASGAGIGLWQALLVQPRRLGLATYRLTTVLGCGLVAVVVLLVGDRVDAYVPSAEELTESVWIALAVLAASRAARSLTGRTRTTSQLMRAARRSLDPRLVSQLWSQVHTDPTAVVAIAYTEELNRPRWVRRLERVLVRRHGSYGLMQVSAPRPLSDAASVEEFIGLLPTYPALEDGGPESLRTFFLHHNDDTAFADLATAVYNELVLSPVEWGMDPSQVTATVNEAEDDLLDDLDRGDREGPAGWGLSYGTAAVVAVASFAGSALASRLAWHERPRRR